jgi:predicted nucleic acid-binding protein
MDESGLRREIAALRDLLEGLAESRAERRDWDRLMDRADAHLIAIAECLDAILETDEQLAVRVAQILGTRQPDAGTETGAPGGDDA